MAGTFHLRFAIGLALSWALVAATTMCGANTEKACHDVIAQAVADGIPGIQAYVRCGSTQWEGAAGLCSIEEGRLMTLAARIRVASITKMMTYAATMEFVKKGRLRLQDQAINLLPPGTLDGVPYKNEITVAHLLDHQSGLHNFNGDDSQDFFADLYGDPQWGTRRWTPMELLGYAKKPAHQPTGKPGERTSYSSTGYIILEMALEHLEKKPLDAIYRELFFDPLEMKTAGVEGADFGTEQIADSYARPDTEEGSSPFRNRKRIRSDGLVNLSKGLKYYNAWAHGAGAVAMSVQDLAKFMEAVESGRLTVLKDQEAQFARAKQKPNAHFEWNGGSRGIQATIVFEPHDAMMVIVLNNASNSGPSSHDTARLLLAAACKP